MEEFFKLGYSIDIIVIIIIVIIVKSNFCTGPKLSATASEVTLGRSSIQHEGTRTFFHMVDRYFGNDSLQPFKSKFISSTGLAMAYLWLSWPSLMRGYETIFQ